MIPPPTTHDGRNLDPALADTDGEAATVRVKEPEVAAPVQAELHGPAPTDTYYDLPVVKAAPWKWYVPAYFHAGGLAGAASTLAGAASLAGEHGFARRLHWIAAIGEAAGAACLVADLGRPSRFHYMLRVFRPTSPMNLGTWILSAAGATTGLALVRPRSHVAGIGGALAGALLATYTAVLVGNTAIPVWSATRRILPLHFAAASAASLASVLDLVAPRPAYGVIARSAELVTGRLVARSARVAGVDRPLREGRSGGMWRAAAVLGAGGLVAALLGRPRAAGILGTIATVLGRMAIVEAGRASAADPRATFEPQRQRGRMTSNHATISST